MNKLTKLFFLLSLSLATIGGGCNKTDSSEVVSTAPIYGPAPIVNGPESNRNVTKVDGREIESQNGSSITYKSTTTKTGKGVGASLRTDSAETAANFKTGAPTASFGGEDGGSSTGGLLDANFSMKFPKGTSPLLWVGVLGIVGAGGCLYLGLKRAALICLMGGLGFVAASFLPGAAVVILCLLGLMGAGFYIYAEHKNMSYFEAARALHDGIKDLPEAERKKAEEYVAAQATTRDAKTILDLSKHV